MRNRTERLSDLLDWRNLGVVRSALALDIFEKQALFILKKKTSTRETSEFKGKLNLIP